MLSKTEMMYMIHSKTIILILVYNFRLNFSVQIEFRNHNMVLVPLEVLANIQFCVNPTCFKDVTLILLEANLLACVITPRTVLAFWVQLQNKNMS